MLSVGILAASFLRGHMGRDGVIHKTFFPLAWIVFAALLWGPVIDGVARNVCNSVDPRWVYFSNHGFYGSRFALEFILS